MTVLIGLSIVLVIVMLLIPAEEVYFFGLPVIIILTTTMIYLCYKKLKTIEAKLDKMNENDKSDK